MLARWASRLIHMDADGDGQRPLTDGPTFDFGASFSKDGRTFVFCRDREGVCHLWAMNADGSNLRPLTDGPWFDCSPSFSPDGGRIAFSGGKGAKTISPRPGTRRPCHADSTRSM